MVKEEMYEEEEDDLPRHYKYLTAHLQTGSSDLNHRVNAYISTQAAMATMARYNEINKLFSESFPSANSYQQQQQQQQQLGQSVYMQPLVNTGPFSPTLSGSGSPRSPPAAQTTGQTQPSEMKKRKKSSVSTPSPSLTNHAVPSPPALSPSSNTVDTPASKNTPYQTPTAFPNLPLDPQMQHPHNTSIFTSELSNDVKMMANVDMNDPMATYFFGGNPSQWSMFGQVPSDDVKGHYDQGNVNTDELFDSISGGQKDDDYLFSPVEGSMGQHLDLALDSYSRLGTPGASEAWESFVDFGSEQ